MGQGTAAQAAGSGMEVRGAAEWGGHPGLNIWRTLGYMLNRTWITTAFFSAVLFQRYAPGEMAGISNDVYRSSVLALAMALFVFALLHRPIMAMSQHQALDFAGPALAGAGVLLLVPWLAGGLAMGQAAMWGSAALTGAGSALVLLALGRRFVGVDVRTCIREILWATAGCAVLTFAIMSLPFAAAVLVEVALPFCCVAALHRIPLPGQEGALTRTSFGERISTKMLLKLATCAAVLGIMAGITRDLYFGSDTSALDRAYQLVNCFVPLVAALVLLGSMAATREASIETLYKPAVFFCIAGFALMPVSGPDISLPFAVVTAGYTLFEILVWVILSEVARRFQFTSVQVFGFGRAFVLLVGVIAGAFIANMLLGLGAGPQLISAVAAVGIISVTFLRTYVLGSEDVAAFGRNIGEEGEALSVVLAESERASRASGETPTSKAAVAAGKSRGDMPAGAGRGGTDARKVPFQRKCAIIGEYYGLTRREVDVFRLIAAGRNSTRIQEELSISAGTVNTHSHHIFQKLDVHSQQEVIDLFQHADLDAMQEELAKREE